MEPKFKIGDFVKTNELYNEWVKLYKVSFGVILPGAITGIVTHITDVRMWNSDEIESINVKVDSYKYCLNQDFWELAIS